MPPAAQGVFVDAAVAAQEAFQIPDGGGDDGGSTRRELRSLRRMTAAAADPLVALGRSTAGVVVRRLGSTSALALTGGIGVLRVGVGALRGQTHACCCVVRSYESVSKSSSASEQLVAAHIRWASVGRGRW
jgi:hypothetical protein